MKRALSTEKMCVWYYKRLPVEGLLRRSPDSSGRRLYLGEGWMNYEL
jgi:hypothetical protein